MNPSRLLLCTLLCTALTVPDASAAPTPERLALHPCVIVGEAGTEAENLAAICATVVAKHDVELTDSSAVRGFLANEPELSCAGQGAPEQCLARLARATQGARALLITLAPFARTPFVRALIVERLGTASIKELPLKRRRAESTASFVRRGVEELLSQVDLHPVDISPLVAEDPKPAPTPQPPVAAAPAPNAPPAAALPAAAPAKPPRTWRTPAGIAGLGVGALALGAAGLFTLHANDALDDLDALHGERGYALATLPEATRLRERADSRQRLSLVSGIAGAGLLAGGGFLLWSDRLSAREPARPARAQLLLAPTGAAVRVRFQ